MTGRMGAPFPLINPLSAVIISEAGNFDQDNGVRIMLAGNNLIFAARLDGAECEVGMKIEHVLEAIQEYTKAHES